MKLKRFRPVPIFAAALLVALLCVTTSDSGAMMRWRFVHRHRRHAAIVARTTTTSTSTTTSTTTTAAPTTTTAAPAPATTAVPTTAKPIIATPTTAKPAPTPAVPAPAPSVGFPTAASTGVPAGTALKVWPGSWTTSSAALPTTTFNGMTYRVIDGYVFDAGASGQFLAVDDAYVIIRNSRFVTTSASSNGGAMVQVRSSNRSMILQNSELDGGPAWPRGIQSDTGDLVVSGNRFHNTGESAVEKNDPNSASSLTVTDNYVTVDKGWPGALHVDGIQVGDAKNVTIRHNTVLIQPYGGAEGNTSYVSNSAVAVWAEGGNGIQGTVIIDNNLLAGGGRTIYVQQKSPYPWAGAVTITNNSFDVRFGANASVWGPLYPSGLPANLAWSANSFSDGRAVSITGALSNYP